MNYGSPYFPEQEENNFEKNYSAEQLKSDIAEILEKPGGLRVFEYILTEAGLGDYLTCDEMQIARYNFALEIFELLKNAAPQKAAIIWQRLN